MMLGMLLRKPKRQRTAALQELAYDQTCLEAPRGPGARQSSAIFENTGRKRDAGLLPVPL